jgi:hypothetical protein
VLSASQTVKGAAVHQGGQSLSINGNARYSSRRLESAFNRQRRRCHGFASQSNLLRRCHVKSMPCIEGLLCIFTLFLITGCRGGHDPAKLIIPGVVQSAISAPSGGNEQVRVQAAGRFLIDSTTIFCGWDDQALDTSAIFRRLGQPAYLNGSPRDARGESDARCSDKHNVRVRHLTTANQVGQPYKIVMALWQGDPSTDGAFWVGTVERIDGVRDDVEIRTNGASIDFSNSRTRRAELTEMSIDSDNADLIMMLASYLKDVSR